MVYEVRIHIGGADLCLIGADGFRTCGGDSERRDRLSLHQLSGAECVRQRGVFDVE